MDEEADSKMPPATSEKVAGRHTTTNNIIKEELTEAIDSVFEKHRRMGKERIGELLSDVVWDVRDSAAQPNLLKKSSKSMRDNLYTPHAVLKAMDIAGAALNGQGLEVLRTVETKNERYYRGSMLPCATDVDRCKKIVEEFGDMIVPWKFAHTKYGEGIEFDNEKAVRCIIAAYGLTSAAKVRSIRVAQATDAFQVTKKITMQMGGMKMQDSGAICPITGLPIFTEDLKDTTAQSQNNHFPLDFFL